MSSINLENHKLWNIVYLIKFAWILHPVVMLLNWLTPQLSPINKNFIKNFSFKLNARFYNACYTKFILHILIWVMDKVENKSNGFYYILSTVICKACQILRWVVRRLTIEAERKHQRLIFVEGVPKSITGLN